jgi:hypothetical protein
VTPQELLKHDPELFAAVRQLGVDAERQRVTDHLAAAEITRTDQRPIGGPGYALQAIFSGEEVTAATFRAHFDFQLRRVTQNVRQTETDEAGAIIDGAMRSRSHDFSGSGATAVADEIDRIMDGAER